MKNLILLTFASVLAFGQAVVLPVPKAQFFNNNGQPLAGGLVYSYLAGTSTPTPTYQNAAGTTANTNPVVLDSTGRANIWLLTTLSYKIVVQTSAGLTLYTTDGITGAAGGTAGGQWTTSGTNIYNSNTGRVGVGCMTPVALLDICGSSSGQNYVLRIDDATNSPGINFYGIGNNKLGTVGADASAAFRVRAANDATQIIVNQGSVLFQDQTATTGSTTVTLQGGASQTSHPMLSFNSNAGNQLAYVDDLGRFVSPLFNASTTGGATFTFQNSNSRFLVNGNGDISASGTLHNVGNVQIDGALTVLGGCTGCGGGGGGGSAAPPTGGIQYNGGGTTFAASPKLTWDTTNQILTAQAVDNAHYSIYAGTGYMLSDLGYNVNPSTGTNYNVIQATAGGVRALSGTFTKYVQVGNNGGVPSVTSGDSFAAGSLYYDTVAHNLQVFNDSSAWVALATGGATAPGGADQNVQFNSAGSFAGSGNLQYDPTNQILTSKALDAAHYAIYAQTGYMLSDLGYNVNPGTGTNYNVIQATTGGVAARSAVFSKYIMPGIGTADPTVTSGDTFVAGAAYYNTSNDCLKVRNNAGTFLCLSAGSGITSLNSLTGAVTLTNGGLANEITVTPSGSTIALTLPQGLGGGSVPTFTGVNVAGAYNSTASGSTPAFQLSSLNFYVDGNGNQNLFGRLYVNGGIQVGSWPSGPFTNVITNVGAAGADGNFRNITVTGTCTGCGGGGGVSSLSGTGNQVLVNGTTGIPITGAATLTLPQSIGTANSPTFANVTTTGTHQSTASGGSTAFNVSNGLGSPFIVDGNGNISGNGSINMGAATGLGAYRVGGVIVIDASRTLVNINSIIGTGSILMAGQATFGTGLAVGGHTGITSSSCSHWSFGICDAP